MFIYTFAAYKIFKMTKYEQIKLVQIALYVLQKTGGIDYYHLFKILYFAELKHLEKWGSRITSDNFYALDYGPVPTYLYDVVKGCNVSNTDLLKLFSDNIQSAGKDAPNVLLPKVEVNMNYISKSEIEALDASIEENAYLTFSQLKTKSHDSAWYEAYHHAGSKAMSSISMAKASGADDATLEYIQEQIELGEVLA